MQADEKIAVVERNETHKSADEIDFGDGRRNWFCVTEQMANHGFDVVDVNYVRTKNGMIELTGEAVRKFGKYLGRNY